MLACMSMKGKKNSDSFLTVDDAARLVGLSHWTLRMWLKKLRLTKYKSGSRIVISRTELLALIQPQEIAPARTVGPATGRLASAAPPPSKEKP
jgi:excisionase family DNA binding protein